MRGMLEVQIQSFQRAPRASTSYSSKSRILSSLHLGLKVPRIPIIKMIVKSVLKRGRLGTPPRAQKFQ